MSRLTADQDNRGGNDDPGSGEEDSVMGVNLAEGCGAVNAASLGLLSLSGLSRLSGLFGLWVALMSSSFCCLTRTRQSRQTE